VNSPDVKVRAAKMISMHNEDLENAFGSSLADIVHIQVVLTYPFPTKNKKYFRL